MVIIGWSVAHMFCDLQFRKDCDWGRIFDVAVKLRKKNHAHIERALTQGDETYAS